MCIFITCLIFLDWKELLTLKYDEEVSDVLAKALSDSGVKLDSCTTNVSGGSNMS